MEAQKRSKALAEGGHLFVKKTRDRLRERNTRQEWDHRQGETNGTRAAVAIIYGQGALLRLVGPPMFFVRQKRVHTICMTSTARSSFMQAQRVYLSRNSVDGFDWRRC